MVRFGVCVCICLSDVYSVSLSLLGLFFSFVPWLSCLPHASVFNPIMHRDQLSTGCPSSSDVKPWSLPFVLHSTHFTPSLWWRFEDEVMYKTATSNIYDTSWDWLQAALWPGYNCSCVRRSFSSGIFVALPWGKDYYNKHPSKHLLHLSLCSLK